jgi:hypothetical protein
VDPVPDQYFSENILAPGIEPGTNIEFLSCAIIIINTCNRNNADKH